MGPPLADNDSRPWREQPDGPRGDRHQPTAPTGAQSNPRPPSFGPRSPRHSLACAQRQHPRATAVTATAVTANQHLASGPKRAVAMAKTFGEETPRPRTTRPLGGRLTW